MGLIEREYVQRTESEEMELAVTGDIVSAIIGLECPEMLALKLCASLAGDLLSSPRVDRTAPVVIIAKTAGRVRMRVPAIKWSPQLAARAEARLKAQPGVREVKANPTTATVVVCYDEKAIKPEALQKVASLLMAANRRIDPDGGYRLPQTAASVS